MPRVPRVSACLTIVAVMPSLVLGVMSSIRSSASVAACGRQGSRRRHARSPIGAMFFLGSLLFAGAPGAADWAKTYGGGGRDGFNAVQPTTDGGYVAAGSTTSFDAGGSDAWVVKLDADGSVAWQKTYGGAADDYGYFVRPTSDGGFMVTGTTRSFGTGSSSLWVLKVDSNGNVVWQRTFGASDPVDARPTADGGLFVTGNDGSALKLDASGNIVWQKYVEVFSPGIKALGSGQQTADGGYVLAGFVSPRPIEASGWLAKLDASGDVVWLKLYNSSTLWATAWFVQTTSDGGYIMVGAAGAPFCAPSWVQKLDGSGNVLWSRTYDNLRNVAVVQEAPGDGIVISSDDRPCLSASGPFKAVVTRLGAGGDIIWQNAYGSDGFTSSLSARPTSDGGYIAAGRTGPYGSGDDDAWVLKLDAGGSITGCASVTASSATSAGVPSNVRDGTPYSSIRDVTPANSTASVRDSSATTLQRCYYVPPTEPPVCAMSASTAAPRVGNTLLLNANCTNSPTRYGWSGCLSTGGPTCSDVQTVPGARAYSVTATNAIGTSTSVSITVTWLPALPTAATEIPTLSDWSLLIVSGALGMCAVAMMRRGRSNDTRGYGGSSDPKGKPMR